MRGPSASVEKVFSGMAHFALFPVLNMSGVGVIETAKFEKLPIFED